MNSHKEGCGAPIFGEEACTCVDRWSPQAKLEECGNYTGDMYQDHRGGFVKFSDHQQAIREAILETRKQTLFEAATVAESFEIEQDHDGGYSGYAWTDNGARTLAKLGENLRQLSELSSPAASKPQDAGKDE